MSRLVERMQHYVIPVSGTTPTEGFPFMFDLDAPFRMYGICVWNMGVPSDSGFDGQLALRYTRPDNRFSQHIITASNLLFPGNRYNFTLTPNKAMVCPVYPNILYPAGSTIRFDLTALGTLSPGTLIVLTGVKIFNQGEVWAPTYPKKWTARQYLDRLVVNGFVANGTPVYNNIFTAQSDSDFVWQAGVYSDLATETTGCPAHLVVAVAQLIDLGVIVKDPDYKPYSNTFVPAALLFPFLGSEMPGFLYPEIYIPSQQQLLFDLNYLYTGFTPTISPVEVMLGLKGMKVYNQA